MKNSIRNIRIVMLLYLIILYPFFHFNTPIRFLLIDSFLAYVPIECYFMLRKVNTKKCFFVFGFLYVLFLPNNAYLLTDLIHLGRIPFYGHSNSVMTENSFNWLMFSLVISGIFGLTFIGFKTEISVIERLKHHFKWTQPFYMVIQIGLFVLVSYGVFLGRFNRLNSVQLFTNLPQVVVNIKYILTIDSMIFILLFTLIQLFFFYCHKHM